jgi:hypothetical protein
LPGGLAGGLARAEIRLLGADLGTQEFGGAPEVWVSPLASLFWLFDLGKVAQSHIFLPHLRDTESIFEATAVIRECRKVVPGRPSTDIPL